MLVRRCVVALKCWIAKSCTNRNNNPESKTDMEHDSMTETVEQGVLPEVLAFLDEAPPEYWDELTKLLFEKIEKLIRKYNWSGRSEPEPLEVFHDAYTAIFITGGRSWNPSERNTPSQVEGLSNNWSPSMWSFYRYLTEKLISRGINHRPISVLEAIILNMASIHSNSKNRLTGDPAMALMPDNDESPDLAVDLQRGDVHKAEAKHTGKKNIYYILPSQPLTPDKKAVADDEWRLLERCIRATNFDNKEFLVAVLKHIWSWRPVRDKEDLTKEEVEWKAEYCAPEIASQFPDQTVAEIQQRIYRAKARHLPTIAIEYEFARFLDLLPHELRKLARFYRTNVDAPFKVRIEQFSVQTGIALAKVAAMHLEFEKYRDEWVKNPLSNLIKKKLGGLCDTSEHE